MRRFDAVVLGSIAALFLALAGRGIWAYFVTDDLMNLYLWWREPVWKLAASNLVWFSPGVRPLGGLFYCSIFAVAGLDPVPFRVAAFALMIANLVLFYAVVLRLTSSRETAALATLFASYNGVMIGLYENTATIYDILAFTCYFGALAYYFRIRQAGAGLSRRQLIAFLALYAAALNSKEIAATLPLAVAAYELFFQQRRRWTPAIAAALMNVPYVIAKMRFSEAFHEKAAFTPHLTFGQFEYTAPLNMSHLFHGVVEFDFAGTVAVWAAMLLIAWLSRVAVLRWAWVQMLVAPLPVAFLLPHRGGFNLYIAYAALSLFAAAALVKLRQRFAPAAAAAALLFLGALAVQVFAQGDDRGYHHALEYEQQYVREVIGAVRGWRRSLPPRTEMLFASDPLPADVQGYTIHFAAWLHFHDPSLVVTRAAMFPPGAPELDPDRYDYVLRIEKGKMIELRAPGPPVPATLRLENVSRPGASDFIVGEKYRVTVTGTPNRLVGVNAAHNGGRAVYASYGRTGADGTFRLSGVMGPETEGAWDEEWLVGRVLAGRVKLRVNPR